MNIRLLGSAALAAFVVESASAAIVVTTNQALWNAKVATFGSVEVETFNEIADGFHPSPFSGSTGSVGWSAEAEGGLFVSGGMFSTNIPEPLTFTFTPGVRAVAGNFFGTDFDFNSITVIFSVALANGTTYEGYSEGASSFTGFRSTAGETISSLTLTVVAAPGFGGGGPSAYPTVDNLYFGVIPAPGALALLGAAGMIGYRRRR